MSSVVMRFSYLVILSFFLYDCLVHSQSALAPSYVWLNRTFSCEHYPNVGTRCVIYTPQFVVEQNSECFDEIDSNNRTKTYCSISCAESDETSLVFKKPQTNKCSMFFTYNLERRRKDCSRLAASQWVKIAKEKMIRRAAETNVSQGHALRNDKLMYLWRSGTCVNTTIDFHIACGTYKDPREFYFKNEHLFEYEDGDKATNKAEPGVV